MNRLESGVAASSCPRPTARTSRTSQESVTWAGQRIASAGGDVAWLLGGCIVFAGVIVTENMRRLVQRLVSLLRAQCSVQAAPEESSSGWVRTSCDKGSGHGLASCSAERPRWDTASSVSSSSRGSMPVPTSGR